MRSDLDVITSLILCLYYQDHQTRRKALECLAWLVQILDTELSLQYKREHCKYLYILWKQVDICNPKMFIWHMFDTKKRAPFLWIHPCFFLASTFQIVIIITSSNNFYSCFHTILRFCLTLDSQGSNTLSYRKI